MSELEELKLAYAECSRQRNELLNKLKSQAQREWVGLTDEEIRQLWDDHTVPVFGKIGINPIVFARAIEAAHGIGDKT